MRDAMRRAHELGECCVKIFKEGDRLKAILIYLKGISAQFPSTSNSREIRYKWINSKAGFRKKVPFLSKTKFQQEQLGKISALYTEALVRCGVPFPSFYGEKVHVLALLASMPRKFDSHNFSKPIGDWLEHVGIITDDTNAEIHCFKCGDYERFKENEETTIILVQPRTQTQQKSEILLKELFEPYK